MGALPFLPFSYFNTHSGAETGNRTPDLILTMNVLYQLSYLGLVLGEGFEPPQA